jgi:hypothetical protein
MKATYLKEPCPLLTDMLTKGQLADYQHGDLPFAPADGEA